MERSRLLCIILGIVVLVETVILLRPTPDPIVAKFSGEVITRKTLSDKLIELYGRELLQEMITDRLIDKSIAQAKIETTPQELNRWVDDYKKRPDAQEIVLSKQLDEDKLKENLKRTVGMYKLALQDVPETERQKYFSQHKSNFAEMELRIGWYFIPIINPDKYAYYNLNHFRSYGEYIEARMAFRIFSTGKRI